MAHLYEIWYTNDAGVNKLYARHTNKQQAIVEARQLNKQRVWVSVYRTNHSGHIDIERL